MFLAQRLARTQAIAVRGLVAVFVPRHVFLVTRPIASSLASER